MPKFRLLHQNYRTGARMKKLTRLEKDVWEAIVMSADDFGICQASAKKLMADDPWLSDEPRRHVERSIERVVNVGLFDTFDDGGDRYLFQPDWQDWQRIKHPTKSSLPTIPAEQLVNCTPRTIALFLEHHEKRSEILRIVFLEHPERGELLRNVCATFAEKVFQKFLQEFPKVAEVFPLHARAQNATATASSDLGTATEKGSTPVAPAPEWPKGPRKVEPVTHRGHIHGFCDWVCLPEFLFNEFVGKCPGGVGVVDTWAKHTRREWKGREITENNLDFWRNRWQERPQAIAPASNSIARELAESEARRRSVR